VGSVVVVLCAALRAPLRRVTAAMVRFISMLSIANSCEIIMPIVTKYAFALTQSIRNSWRAFVERTCADRAARTIWVLLHGGQTNGNLYSFLSIHTIFQRG
jgi:hypothetical protein